jgi:tetratricopeptide (TPR) repeat protein
MVPIAEKPKAEAARRYPRHKAPKWLCVGWRGAGQGTVSQAETISMGGLFLHTPTPLAKGSIIDLLFDLQSGEVRARAVVRHQTPGKGMGVQFVQMQASARSRLSQFLARFSVIAAQPIAEAAGDANAQTNGTVIPPFSRREAGMSDVGETAAQFEKELTSLLELARSGTYYQVLGVYPDSPRKHIRQAFHAVAQKFHPDHHMEMPQWLGRLQDVMGFATLAYKTLSDDEKRAQYDARLSASGAYNLRRAKSASQESIEQSLAHANECIRAGNFVGSIVWLRKCVELSSDDAKYHALLGRSLSAVPQYHDEAMREFQRAIDLDPLNTVPYFQFAELCELRDMPSRARELYSKILEINPAHAKARERLIPLQNA